MAGADQGHYQNYDSIIQQTSEMSMKDNKEIYDDIGTQLKDNQDIYEPLDGQAGTGDTKDQDENLYGYATNEEYERARHVPSPLDEPLSQNNILKLRCNKARLCSDLDVTVIEPSLIQEQVLTPVIWDKIKCENPTPQGKTSAFLDYLEKRTEKAFWAFCSILKPNYIHLYQLLQKPVPLPLPQAQRGLPAPPTAATGVVALFSSRVHTDFEADNGDDGYINPNDDFNEVLEKQMKEVPEKAQIIREKVDRIQNTQKRESSLVYDDIHALTKTRVTRENKVELRRSLNIKGSVIKKGETVVVSKEAATKESNIVVITRRGKTEVNKRDVKLIGDPRSENYFFSDKLEQESAIEFLEQQMEETPMSGIFIMFEPKESSLEIPFYLCVTRRGEAPIAVPIFVIMGEGYSLYRNKTDVGRIFKTVTELVRYYHHTTCPVLPVRLRCPLELATECFHPTPSEDEFSDYGWDPSLEINSSDLNPRAKRVGEGNYAIVQKVRYKSTPTAMKTLNDLHTSLEDKYELLEEAKMLMDVKHENIIALVGVRFTSEPFLILTEYVRDCLQTKLRHKKFPANYPFQKLVLLPIMSAMKYLEGRGIIHRDLASRNVLVGDNNVVRLIDFGLARKTYRSEDLYRTSEGEKTPYRSASPEVLVTRNYSSKSDVWSAGILIWEIYSDGLKPYNDLMTRKDVMAFVVFEEKRLSRPRKSPDDMWIVMMACWLTEPLRRPSFADLYASFYKGQFVELAPDIDGEYENLYEADYLTPSGGSGDFYDYVDYK